MSSSIDLAIVILNFNGCHLMKEYFPDLVANSLEAKIYLIDNGSSDDSIKWVEKHYESAKIISLNHNKGYAGGYNQGLREVREPLLCLLNNDVKVPKNWLVPILKAFETDPKLTAAQPLILDLKNPNYFEYAGAAGGFLDFFGVPYCRGRILNYVEQNTNQYDVTKSIFWASGACFFIKKKCFFELGGFDEDFFSYQEEIDLCWRLNRAGHQIKTIGSTHVYHLGGGSSSKSSSKVFYDHRNSLKMLFKNLSLENLVVVLPVRLIMDFFFGLVYLFRLKFSLFGAIVMSHYEFYKNINTLYKKRRGLKKFQYIKHHRTFSVILLYLKKSNSKT